MFADPSLTRYGSNRANPVFNLMNPTDVPYGRPPAEVNRDLKLATDTLNIGGTTSRGAYNVSLAPNFNAVPDSESRLAKAIRVCEAVKKVDCNAFKDPEFAKTCMITHEPGRNSRNESHQGGLVLFEEDREAQLHTQKGKRFPTFTPTIGESKPNLNSSSYDTCVALQEKIACERQGNFSLPNCGLCQNGMGKWTRIAPDAPRVGPSIVLLGEGKASLYFNSQGINLGSKQLNMNSPQTFELPPESEGGQFTLEIDNGSNRPKVAGYIEGPHSTGVTRIDIAYLSQNENIYGGRPRYMGFTKLNNEDVVILTNNARQGQAASVMDAGMRNMVAQRSSPGAIEAGGIMSLSPRIPYTFLDSSEEASEYCPGGPYSTKEQSLKDLGADPCYNPNKPGQYNLECLQGKWLQAGCTADGLGYPRTQQQANALLNAGGQPQHIGAIAQRVYNMSLEAQTGMRDGTKMTLTQWNDVSEQCTGKRLTTPCSPYDIERGPLGDECIQWLYENRGDGVAKTYDQQEGGATYRYKNFQSDNPLGPHCTRQGTAAPYTPQNLAAARAKGGVNAVKAYFNEIQAKAQDNSLADDQRKSFVEQCYGINFAPDPSKMTNNPTFVPDINVTLKNPANDAVRHQDFVMWHQPSDGSALYKQDSTFKLREPLCGKVGYVSMEAVNFPNYYVINDAGRAKIVPKESSVAYADKACWKIAGTTPDGRRQMNIAYPEDPDVKVGCGLPGMFSLENKFAAGGYMRSAPGPNKILDVYIPKTEADKKEMCFSLNPGNWPPSR